MPEPLCAKSSCGHPLSDHNEPDGLPRFDPMLGKPMCLRCALSGKPTLIGPFIHRFEHAFVEFYPLEFIEAMTEEE